MHQLLSIYLVWTTLCRLTFDINLSVCVLVRYIQKVPQHAAPSLWCRRLHSLRKFNTRWICLKYILQTVIWSDITILTPIRFHPGVPSRWNRVFYLLRWLMVTRVSYLYHNVLILYQQKIAVIPGIWGSVEMTFLRCAELTLYRCTMDLCIIIFLAT